MNIARICGRLGVGALVDLIVEQFEDDSARQIDKRRVDRDAGNANDLSEVGLVSGRAQARPDAKEVFPEGQGVVDAGGAHADMMDCGGGRDRCRKDYCVSQKPFPPKPNSNPE